MNEEVEFAMISCSYNGWTDFPEEEREAMDAFEAAHALPAPAPTARLLLLPRVQPARKAA
jgi:hypothetical protein